MTRDDIIRMARSADLHERVQDGVGYIVRIPNLENLERFAALAAIAEREKVAAWMRSKSYSTGHGDTIDDLLKELEWQVTEREREACAKVCDHIKNNIYNNNHEDAQPMAHAVANFCAAAIRARNEA